MKRSKKKAWVPSEPGPVPKVLRLAALLLPLFVYACAAVGPDYQPAPVDAPKAWHNAAAEAFRPPDKQTALVGDWWRQLDDPLLTRLVQSALEGNRDLRQARARLREVRARLGISRADDYPTLAGSAAATRSRSSGDVTGRGESDSYSVGFDAGWELDIFGGVRRSVEAARVDMQADEMDLRAVWVSLAAEVVRNYAQVRIVQARLAVTRENLVAQQETWQLAQWRCEAGLSDELAVQQAQYNLESTRARLPGLQTELEAAMNRIAVLLGQTPGSLQTRLSPVRPIPRVPTRIAVGLPADTVRQRPDVARAERQLAAQTARVGVAEAEFYPKLRISGTLGWGAPSSSDLFASGSQASGLGPKLTWRLFEGGAIRRAVDAQKAVVDQYLARYQASVLTALEEVENALQAFVQEQQRRQHLQAAAEAAQSAYVLARGKYQAGLSDFGNVLDAQRSLLGLQDNLIQSRGTVITDLLALYKALGGGWQMAVATDAGD